MVANLLLQRLHDERGVDRRRAPLRGTAPHSSVDVAWLFRVRPDMAETLSNRRK
jgi:hypothetical protein